MDKRLKAPLATGVCPEIEHPALVLSGILSKKSGSEGPPFRFYHIFYYGSIHARVEY
jgi:hypothetical protein